MFRRQEAGFTLIELMVVLAIIAILASISFVQFSEYAKKAEDRAAEADVKNFLTQAVASSQR